MRLLSWESLRKSVSLIRVYRLRLVIPLTYRLLAYYLSYLSRHYRQPKFALILSSNISLIFSY